MSDKESKKTQPSAEPQEEQASQAPEAPAGPVQIDVPSQMKDQANIFLERAKEIGTGGNHEYAIQMCLEALRRNPDALQVHQLLLEQALRRQAAGGKKAGLMASLKLKLGRKGAPTQFLSRAGSKDPVDELLAAEDVWSKDPVNLDLVDAVLEKMVAAGCLVSGKWLAMWLTEANSRPDKQDGRRFSMLADVFAQLAEPDKAVELSRRAVSVLPDEPQLAAKLRDMLALQTMRKGKYDDQGFQQSLQNKEEQDTLHQSETVSRRVSAADENIARARKNLEEDPTQSSKVMALADALLLKDDQESDNEAIEVLQKAYQQSKAYRFKQRAGEIQLRSNRRIARALRAQVQSEPENQELAQTYKKMLKQNLEAELAHFQDSAKNYPTDMRLRYEIGRRLLQLARYDEAIPALQEGQRDPKNRLRALSLLGQCFYRKEWYSDAIDVYLRALESPDAAAGDISKELQYYLGRAYEGETQLDKAAKAYSTVAQIDFLYKDVRDRLGNIRKLKKQNPADPGGNADTQ